MSLTTIDDDKVKKPQHFDFRTLYIHFMMVKIVFRDGSEIEVTF